MKTRILPLIAIAAILLTGCNKPAPTTSAPAVNPADGRAIEITADDTMKYSVTEIRATPGEKLVIVLKNIGRMPKQAMAHNWVLLKPMDDSAAGALAMSAAARLPDYMPADMSSILAHTKMVGSGESDTLKLTAPTEPGTYPYLCTFPGHFALMHGKLIVQ